MSKPLDGLVKKNIVHLPIGLKENLKCTSGNLLKPLVADNMDLGAALQMLLRVILCLLPTCRLLIAGVYIVFQSNIILLMIFEGDSAVVGIIGVSVIAMSAW